MLIFLAIVAAVMLILVVVVIYLNDRVNELERRTVASVAADGTDPGGWGGLAGKRLWDAMCGKPVPKLDPAMLALLRPHYEAVLSKHIEGLFRDGLQDGRKSEAKQPTAVRKIASTRGPVDSWIPLNHANTLYRGGVDAAKGDMFEIARVRLSIDEVAEALFAQTGLMLTQRFSDVLLPDPNAPAADPGAAAAATDPAGAGAGLAPAAAAPAPTLGAPVAPVGFGAPAPGVPVAAAPAPTPAAAPAPAGLRRPG